MRRADQRLAAALDAAGARPLVGRAGVLEHHPQELRRVDLAALKAASDNKAQRAVKFTFANSQKVVFCGYIGCTLLPVVKCP